MCMRVGVCVRACVYAFVCECVSICVCMCVIRVGFVYVCLVCLSIRLRHECVCAFAVVREYERWFVLIAIAYTRTTQRRRDAETQRRRDADATNSARIFTNCRTFGKDYATRVGTCVLLTDRHTQHADMRARTRTHRHTHTDTRTQTGLCDADRQRPDAETDCAHKHPGIQTHTETRTQIHAQTHTQRHTT